MVFLSKRTAGRVMVSSVRSGGTPVWGNRGDGIKTLSATLGPWHQVNMRGKVAISPDSPI